ncbi:MAG TPA: aminopeptidase P family protein [Firmicutes bacterium]|nr:aminopeptidase P family protein [Bacillota bacterium]
MHKELIQQLEPQLKAAGLLPLRQQADLSTKILKERLELVLPWAMEQSGIDFWLIGARENNMDPIMKTLYPWDMPDVRRLGFLAFHRQKNGSIRKMAIGPMSAQMAGIYEKAQGQEEDVWQALGRIVAECGPEKIGVNKSTTAGYSDGLSATVCEQIRESLGANAGKLTASEELAVRWLQRYSPLEKSLMKTLVTLTQEIIKYAFSRSFIKPGKTTTTDVEWFMRDVINRLGFKYWFGPDVDLQREGGKSSKLAGEVILPGDLIHCDIGLSPTYIALHTDMQWLAYLLKEGEERAPQELTGLLGRANRLQDLVRENIEKGGTGNEVFVNSLRRAGKEGINAMIYTHPLGTFGHGAGPLIGRYSDQSELPKEGERRLEEKTFYALELNAAGKIAAWGNQLVYIYLEEVIAKDGGVDFLCGRQDKLLLI